MAHNLEIVNGEASFFSNREPAWHNLGKVVDGARTWKQAMKLANLNYKVEKKPLFGEVSEGEFVQADGAYGIFRSDNNAFLGMVGERYTTVQNEFVFEFMDEILGKDGAHYETAGVLGKGERIFVLANLEQEHDIHGTGDKHKAYFAGHASHDGNSSVRFITTDVRIVCANTLNIALNKAKGKGVHVRHTRDAEQRIKSATEIVMKARNQFKSTMELLEELANREVSKQTVAKTVAQMFGITDMDKEVPTRTANAMLTIKDLFDYNDNDTFKEFRGSAYQLLNAATQYTDHAKEVRMTDGRATQTIEQVRSDSAMFGLGADFKKNALEIILENTKQSKRRDLHRAYSLPKPEKGESVLDAVLAQYN